jgi:flavin-dependent dehydrogenase
MPSPLSNSYDVVIIGGGPAGLATAIAARQHGLSVLVADGAIPPIDKSCGEGLMPDGVEALRQLGIAIPPDEAFPFRGIRFLSHGMKAEAAFPHGHAYGIRRTQLHQLILDHAASVGVDTLWQSPITQFHPEGVVVGGEFVHASWIVGADGSASRTRKLAGLDPRMSTSKQKTLRFGFRRHYRIPPWSDFMELHWGTQSQIYVTPTSDEEVCIALVSSNPKLRLGEALTEFPELATRVQNAIYASTERGAITSTWKLPRVYRGHTALVGDASGGVDAITGEGLCLAFQQAILLGGCLATGNLARYQVGHRSLFRTPALMSHLMLFMANHGRIRQRCMRVFQKNPRSFGRMLAMHVGEGTARDQISNGIVMGWELLKV